MLRRAWWTSGAVEMEEIKNKVVLVGGWRESDNRELVEGDQRRDGG